MARVVFILSITTILLNQQSCAPRRNRDAKILSDNRFGKIFDKSDDINMTLNAPLKRMFNTKNDKEAYNLDLETLDFDPPWFGDQVTIGQAGSQMITAKVKVRGGVRFDCSFPPLKIKFKKDAISGTLFEGFTSIKLGTHCEPPEQEGRVPSIPPREHAMYEMYKLFDEFHFRSRLVNMTYNDTTPAPALRAQALLIEDPESIAKRMSQPQSGLSELKLNWLERTRRPRSGDSPDVVNELNQFQLYAMIQTERIRVMADERKRRKNASPNLSDADIDASLQRDRDAIWTGKQLPALLDYSFPPGLKSRMEALLAPKQKEITLRQQALRAAIDPNRLARILVFETMILNTDWNIFGLRRFSGIAGEGNENDKNVKFLQDKAGQVIPMPYDFNESSIFGALINFEYEFKNRLSVAWDSLSNPESPGRSRFLQALREAVAKEDGLVAAVKTSHMAGADEEKLATAIRTFAACAREFLASHNI